MVKKLWQQHNLIILILVLSLGLRLPLLNGSLWLDEAAQALESARPWSQQLNISGDFQPPLTHLLLFLAIKISTAQWWMRLIVALIPGLITIWASYEIGRKIINQKAGVITALLLSTSSFHIFYSQELRPYSLPTMWAVLSWLWLVKAVTAKKNSPQNWRLFTVFSILGFYSSYLYPFLWASQIIWLLWQHKKDWQKTIRSAVITLLLFIPWLPMFFQQLQAGSAVRTQLPQWDQVVSIPQAQAPLLVIGKFIFGVINIELNNFFILSSVFIFSLSSYLISQNLKKIKQKKSLQALQLLISWLVIPSLSAWLLSFIIPVIRPKRVLFLLPALYLFISFIFTKSTKNKKIANVLVGFLLILNLYGVFQYHLNPNYQRENWRDLHQQISATYSPQETIILNSFPHPFSPWRWYDQENYPTLSTGKLYIKNVSNLSKTISPVIEYRYVLLFDYLRDLSDPDDQLRTQLWTLGFREIDTLDYPGIGFIRIFSKTKPTANL